MEENTKDALKVFGFLVFLKSAGYRIVKDENSEGAITENYSIAKDEDIFDFVKKYFGAR
jgi:hypothetical protein